MSDQQSFWIRLRTGLIAVYNSKTLETGTFKILKSWPSYVVVVQPKTCCVISSAPEEKDCSCLLSAGLNGAVLTAKATARR